MNLLIAVEDAAFARRASALLQACGHNVTVALAVDDTLERLSSGSPPDAVLLGGSPARVALLVATCPPRGTAPRPYLLHYRDGTDADEAPTAAVDGAELDVDDVIVEPCSAREIEARLKLAARIVALEESARSARDWLLFATTHDSVTGALTRAASLDAIDREIARTSRETGTFGVAVLRIDDGEQLQAKHGSVAYDLVLQEVACRLRDTLRTYDLVGRASHGSLLMVIPGLDERSAPTVTRRLRECVARSPYELEHARVTLTCSTAVVIARGATEEDSSDLLDAAEAGLDSASSGSASSPRLRAVTPTFGSTHPTLRIRRGALS